MNNSTLLDLIIKQDQITFDMIEYFVQLNSAVPFNVLYLKDGQAIKMINHGKFYVNSLRENGIVERTL